jgi:DICT domain-containing protein
LCVCNRLLAQRQCLHQQLERVRAAVANEDRVQQQYAATVARYMEDRARRTQDLKDRAEQVRLLLRPCRYSLWTLSS